MSTLSEGRALFLLAAVQVSTTIFALGFTSPHSILRPAVLPVLIPCVYKFIEGVKVQLPQPQAATLGSYASCFLLQYVSMGLLNGWSYETRGPSSQATKTHVKSGANGKLEKKSKIKNNGTVLERIAFGLNSLWSFRDLNTPFEVKNAPHFSAKDPSYVPTRKSFLLRSAVTFCISYLILDIIESQPPAPNAAEMFSAASIPVFSRRGKLSIEDVIVRILGSTGYWVMLSSMLACQNSFLAIIFVGLGLNPVEAWRPLMGPLSEAYTVRGFWGKTWHQGTRKMFADPANFTVDRVLHLPKGSLANRYSKIFLTFFFSGALHAVADMSGGMPFRESGSMRFFNAQAVGIIVEDSVQAVYRSISGAKKGEVSPLWRRVVGFIWVAVFMLFWTTPAWFFPAAARSTGADDQKLTPFSIVGLLLKK